MLDVANLEPLLAGATLTAAEANAIAQIGQLAAGADLTDDDDEHAAYDLLVGRVCALAGVNADDVPVVSPLPVDDYERVGWVGKLCDQLATDRARSIAYAVAYLVVVADLQLAPQESRLLDDLAQALQFDDERIRELSSTIASAITPGERE